MKFNKFFDSASDGKLSCSCGCGGTVTSQLLMTALTVIRVHFNKPITITSGYRCQAYNKRVGGASKSQHLTGNAVDFQVKGVAPSEVQRYIREVWPHTFGMGKGSDFTHLDTRPERVDFSY